MSASRGIFGSRRGYDNWISTPQVYENRLPTLKSEEPWFFAEEIRKAQFVTFSHNRPLLVGAKNVGSDEAVSWAATRGTVVYPI